MSLLPKDRKYYVYPECVDGRKGFNGLMGLVKGELDRDIQQGDVFIFVNRTYKRLKLLFKESRGMVLYYKRLDSGSFQFPMGRPDRQSYTISEAQLLQLLSGAIVQHEKYPVPRQRTPPGKELPPTLRREQKTDLQTRPQAQ